MRLSTIFRKKLKNNKVKVIQLIPSGKLDENEFVKTNSDLFFTEVFDEWLRYHKLEINESTAYGYEIRSPYIKQYFANSLINISTTNINEFIIEMKTEGFSDSNIVNYCKELSLCFNYACATGYISKNPVDKACVPKVPRHTEIYPYTTQEVIKLLKVNYLQWVKDGIMIAFHSGMREGEIYALKWTDINLEQRFIMVQRAQSKTGSKVVLKTTKTASGIRRIDIDKYLTAYLQDMKRSSTSNYVFPSDENSKYEFKVPWNLASHIRKMCMIAGIPPRNFHAMRHTHATVLLSYGVHPKIVQERLGHSDIYITMEIYSHVLPTIQKTAVKVFEQICNKYYGDDSNAAVTVFDNIIELSDYQLSYNNNLVAKEG